MEKQNGPSKGRIFVNQTKAASQAGVNKQPSMSADRAHDQKPAGLWVYKPQPEPEPTVCLWKQKEKEPGGGMLYAEKRL